MVTLTNSTTSTPSVSDVAVSSVVQTNKLVASKSITTKALGTKIAGINTERDVTSFSTLDVIGYEIDGFTGGYLKSFFAFIDPNGSMTGSTIAGIYHNQNLVAVSDVFSYTNFSSSAYWQEFTFEEIYIPPGSLYLVLHSSTGMRVEVSSYLGNNKVFVLEVRDYDGSLPEKVSAEYLSLLLPQMYIEYTPTSVNTLSSGALSWRDSPNTWSGESNTWDDFTNLSELTNIS